MTRLSYFARLTISVLFILSACLQGIQPAAAQEGGVRTAHHPHTGKVSFIGAAAGRAVDVPAARAAGLTQRDRALAMVQRYASDLGLAVASRELQPRTERAERGREITRFQQVYQGIPVMAGELVVNAQGAGMISINGEISPDLALDVKPAIPAELARQAALQAMKKKYQGQAADFTTSEPELWIYDSRLLQPDGLPAALVWRMDVDSADGSAPINELVLIDAQRGNVRLNFNQIDTSWSVGAGSQREPAETQPIPAEAVDAVRAARGPLTPPMVEPPALAGTGTGDRYVSTTGVNTGDCTSSAAPCLTINYAIGQANAGETIYVAVGTYSSTWTVVIVTKDIELIGGWDETFVSQIGASVIDGEGVHTGIQINGTVNNVVLDRFSVQKGSPSGIITYNGLVAVHNSTISNGGGGVYASAGTLTLSNTTVAFNSGGIGGNVDLQNSIVYHNTRGGGHDCSNIYFDANSSIVGPGCIVNSLYNFVEVDPEITTYPVGAAAYHALRATSPAVDAGNPATCLLVDQRAMGRPQGGACDIGAYEYAAPGLESSVWVAHGSGQRAASGYWFIEPLAVYVLDEQGSPMPGINVTFSAPESGPSGIFEGGWSTSAIVQTDAEGLASSPLLRANGLTGGFVLTASAGSESADFQLENVTSTSLEIAGGTPQTTKVNRAFANPLQVLVKDALGAPLPGVTVNFLAPESGASITFSGTGMNILSAVTDDAGTAASGGITANGLAGTYSVQAAVSGIETPLSFALTNVYPDIRTYSRGNGTGSLPGYFVCDLSYPNCTNGVNPHADAAEANAYRTYDFYRARFNRDSINNLGMAIVSTVEYDHLFDNAYWDEELLQMVYGDKSGWPLADDVVAHELTHGVTQYESALYYYYQSGAISESLSDVFGELSDQTNGVGTDTPAVKWLIGEDISGLGAIRSMSEPATDARIVPAPGDPDRITSSHYYTGADDNGGVHTNSGVNNKATYLLVDGGTFNGKTVTALGADKTIALYYEAQTDLLTSGADYADLHTILQQACVNLLGGTLGFTTADCAEVKDAVDAVAMNAQPSSNPNFNTDTPLCGAGQTPSNLFYDTLESGCNPNWTMNSHWRCDSPYDPRAHSGLHYLYADDLPDVVTDVSATMKSSVTLPPNAQLHFAHAYDFEYYVGDPNWYDGGVLEYSTDNGSTWTDIGSMLDFNGYDGRIFTYPLGFEIYNNPLHGRFAFAGTSHGYVSSHADLSSLSGQSVKLRWRMGLDAGGANWGWWLDDVRIYTCSTPMTAAIIGDAGVAAATLHYYDGGPKSRTSSPDGRYTITVPRGWTGTVTPYKQNYTFSPASRSYTDLVYVEPVNNFVATLITHTLTYTPGQNGSILGVHPQIVEHGSDGTPVSAVPDPGYHFLQWSDLTTANPRTDLDVSVDISVVAVFVLNPQSTEVDISGTAEVPGVLLSYDDGGPKSVTADPDGTYGFTVPEHWSGTVTPAKDGYLFSPTSRTYTDLTADQLDQDYGAEKQSIGRFAPDTGATSCRRPQVGVVLNLTALTRLPSGAYNPATVTLKLDNVNVTAQAQTTVALTSPASRVTLLYQPPADLALGPHQAQFTYPGVPGPLTATWNFTAANIACGSTFTMSQAEPTSPSEAQQQAPAERVQTSAQATDSTLGMKASEPAAAATQDAIADAAASPITPNTGINPFPNSGAAQPLIPRQHSPPTRSPHRRVAPWHH